MEYLFKGNVVLLFIFAMLSVCNYKLKDVQKIAIIYLIIFLLALFNIVEMKYAYIFLSMTLITVLEILTSDNMKFKILSNWFYKLVDCIYLSFFQYVCFWEIFAIGLCYLHLVDGLEAFKVYFNILSFCIEAITISVLLRQKFALKSFDKMCEVFDRHPIYKVDFNQKLKDANKILVSIEDENYYKRKSYTILSADYIKLVVNNHTRDQKNLFRKLRITLGLANHFIRNICSGSRGYSTLPMQLIRSMGIESGYNQTFKRKIYELIYSHIFFLGLENFYNESQTEKVGHILDYYLYIYFHVVNTFLEDTKFSKFLNAFDMTYNEENKMDIYNCSNEGIFIACMGLSKRAKKIYLNKDGIIDTKIEQINNVKIDKEKVHEMMNEMMEKQYNGNYLR